MMKTIIDSNDKIRSLYKPLYQRLIYGCKNKKIIFIFGAMRSGTTLISHVFDNMPYALVYGEYSVLSNKDKYGLRWNPIEEIKHELDNSHAPLIVCKPLVESQNAKKILDLFPNSNAIWLYRNYSDSSKSNIVKFGPTRGGINNIRPVVDKDFASNNDWTSWKTENISDKTRELIGKYYDKSMSPNDAAALFWYMRNVTFFEQELYKDVRAHLISYEDFIENPKRYINFIFKTLDLSFPLKDKYFKEIHNNSIGNSDDFLISESLEFELKKLYAMLNNHKIKPEFR